MDKNIEQIGEIAFEIEYEDIVDEFASKALDKVKANVRKETVIRTGRYMNGWTTSETKAGKQGYAVSVHNATDWQLTHLLENGHLIVNKRGGTGWASAHPHIRPAYNSLRNKFVKAIKNAKINAKY